MGLERGSYEAYCFNEAVYVFGAWVIGELDKVKGKTSEAVEAARTRRLQKLLADPKDEEIKPGSFSDPASRLKD